MKNIITSALLLLALMLPATATAHDFEVDGIYYNINGNEASVTYKGSDYDYYNEYSGSVVIPPTVTYNGTTYPVTSISDWTFADCDSLTDIDIPNPVTSIGDGAFYECRELTSIDIPNSVTSIGDWTFYECRGLTSIDIPDSVTYIGEHAFYNCLGLTSIVIPNSVTSIGERTFAFCENLTDINIPNSVTEIGKEAFYYCHSLTSIVIPNSVTSIGEQTFAWCIGLTSIDIPDSVTEIGKEAFYYCSGLTSIDIPNSVTEIGEDAFLNTAWYNNQPDGLVYAGLVAYKYKGIMPSGTNITLREGTLGITSSAFADCLGLTSIVIPNSVTNIGPRAFSYCKGLTSIDIPNSVTSIGSSAFEECNKLTDVYCYIADLSRVSIGYYLFHLGSWNYSGRTLHVLQGMADAYQADPNWYSYFEQIVDDLIPETKYGDVNGDGEVNIADINAVIAIILGGNGDTTAGDVNGDGEVNIADINAIIAIILGGDEEPEHEWVDLGLPSGTLWATMNVGANNPEDYGDYFAWGETEPKEVYNWETYKWGDGSSRELTKYCTKSSYGTVDGKTELDPEDDAAQVNWGPSWRMPTLEQMDELCNYCTWHWTQTNGVNGYQLIGPNGNAIFLPAADCRHDDYPDAEGLFVNYWSRTLDPGTNVFGRVLSSIAEEVWDVYYGLRDYGYSVRAVRMTP